MSVQTPDGCGGWEAGGESGCPELGRPSTRRQHIADGDIFNESGIDACSLKESLECTDEEIGGGGVFETTFAASGEGSPESSGDDNLTCQSVDDQARLGLPRTHIV